MKSDKQTDYGLIGHPLGHSLSPFIHESFFKAAGLAGQYHLIDLPPEELAATMPQLSRDFGGFNCTIPFKEAVIPYLNELDPAAALFGSVNTVWQGRGYNTDYQAFIDNCPAMNGHRILILGAGGVSRTMAFAAAAAGATIFIMARRPRQAAALTAAVRASYPTSKVTAVANLATLTDALDTTDDSPWGLLNGTPLGLWPDTAGMPLSAELLTRFSWVFDTIYNPPATRLVLAARSRGIKASNGLGMLFDQALAAEKIWHPAAVLSVEAQADIRRRLAREIVAKSPVTFLLIGFMGSGKTTVGAALAKLLGMPFVDLDQAIIDAANRSITEIFATSGEPTFRAMEKEQLASLLRDKRSQIVATGGGALIDPAAEDIVRKSPAIIIYLDTPLATIRQRIGQGEGRPLLQNQDADRLDSLFMQRRARYLSLADLRVAGTGTPEEIAAKIAIDLGFEGDNI